MTCVDKTNNVVELIAVDESIGVVFITTKPIKARNEQEEIFVSIYKKIQRYHIFDLYHYNKGFSICNLEIVDITNWDYKDIFDLEFKIRNFPKPTRQLSQVC